MSDSVEVKILHSIGRYVTGQIVDVSEAEAKQLCRKIQFHDGNAVVETHRAIRLDELKKQEAQAKAEATNIVETPVDAGFEAHLAMLKSANEEIAKKPQAEQPGAGLANQVIAAQEADAKEDSLHPPVSAPVIPGKSKGK